MTNTQYDFTKMYTILQELKKTKSTMDIGEFQKYISLFQKKEKVDDNEYETLRDLAIEFKNRINLYKETDIIDHSGNVIFTIPATFIHIDAIDNNYDKNLQKAQNILINSNIPKHTSEAMKCIMKLLLVSQSKTNKDFQKKVEKYRNKFNKRISEFQNKLTSSDTKVTSHNYENEFINDLKEETTEENKNASINYSSLLREI